MGSVRPVHPRGVAGLVAEQVLVEHGLDGLLVRAEVACNSSAATETQVVMTQPALFMRRTHASSARLLQAPEASSTQYTSKPSRAASTAGATRQTSVVSPDMISVLRPVAFTAAT